MRVHRIGEEFVRIRRRRAQPSRASGLGQYALNPKSHLTEDSPRTSPNNLVRLFNEWGFYWNLSQPVLLEKSPPNMVWFVALTRERQRMATLSVVDTTEGV